MVAVKTKSHKDKVSILIEFFIKKPIDINTFNIKGEAIAGSKLLKKYNDFDFFYDLPEYTNKFNSLWGMQTAKMNVELSKKFKDFCYKRDNKPKEYLLEKDPIIQIKIEKQKPRSILEFLNS